MIKPIQYLLHRALPLYFNSPYHSPTQLEILSIEINEQYKEVIQEKINAIHSYAEAKKQRMILDDLIKLHEDISNEQFSISTKL